MNEYYFYIVDSLHLTIANGLAITLMIMGVLVIIFCVCEFYGTYPIYEIDEHEMQSFKLIFKYSVITLMVLSLLNIFVPSGDVLKIMLGN